MKRLSILFLALLFAACGGQTDTPADDDAESAAASEAEMTRPDPMNPVGENLAYPEGWMYRLDQPDPEIVVSADTSEADIYFATMTPGWHITMGQPRAILYHPASTVEGNYTAMAKMHLFDPGPRRNEGYGIFVGGSDLQGPDQEYLYFLLRRSGEYLVKLRQGDDTETLIGWTAHEAVVPFNEDTQGTAENTLEIRATDAQLEFVVNGVVVDSIDREGLPTEGIFGVRLNHAVNVHLEDFSVTQAM